MRKNTTGEVRWSRGLTRTVLRVVLCFFLTATRGVGKTTGKAEDCESDRSKAAFFVAGFLKAALNLRAAM